MKKFLSLVLALIMTMSLVTISAGATEYRDLTDKDEIQYEEAVAVLNRIGVITGYEDGSFRPEGELTRGAAAKIIVSLLIGPEAASNLPNATAPYPDVPASHTFAGVISYCKTAGIISGYGDGTFKPANSLTGFAFAKMLLGALGYKSEIEGFVDTGWTMNVAKVGNVTGLFDRLDFDGAGAVNRETACQLALNTLKATMVTYGGTTVVTGAQALAVQGTQAMYVTSNNREINANINRRVISAQNNEMTLEFGEEHFKDLRLEHDKYDPAYDDFGHPSNEWSYKKVTIGTFKLPADFTFTKQMAHLEDSTATKEKALGLRGYDTYSLDHRSFTANWSTASSNNAWNSPFADATQVTINGWNARVDGNGTIYNYDANSLNSGATIDNARKAQAPTIAEICDLTDNGVTVEVYVCPVDADYITNVVVTRTQLMKVKRVGSDFVTLEDIEPDSRDPRKEPSLAKITGYNAFAIDCTDYSGASLADVKDSNYDAYNALKDMKAGDYVAVVPYTTDDGRSWEVGEAYAPETVSGAFTKVDTYANVNKPDGSAIAITVGGTSYPINEWNKDMLDVTGNKIKATKKDVTLYLAKDGTVLWADEIGNSDAWMVVGDYYQAAGVNGKTDWFVHGWTVGGQEVDLDLGTIRNEAEKYAPGELVYYDISNSSNGEYQLTKPSNNRAGQTGISYMINSHPGNHLATGGVPTTYPNNGANAYEEPKKTGTQKIGDVETPIYTGEGIYDVAQYTIRRDTGLVDRYEIVSRDAALSLEQYNRTVIATDADTPTSLTRYDTTGVAIDPADPTVRPQKQIDKLDPVNDFDYEFVYRNVPYDGVKFIFVSFSANGEVETIDFRSGVQNVTYQDLISYNSNWRNVATNTERFVVSAAEAYVNDKGVVKAVVIKNDSAEADLSKIAVITDTDGHKEEVGASSNVQYGCRYITGPNFSLSEEQYGLFDKAHKIGDIVVLNEKDEDEVFSAKTFHSNFYNNGNPDVIRVNGVSTVLRGDGGRWNGGFLVGQGDKYITTQYGTTPLLVAGNGSSIVTTNNGAIDLLTEKYTVGFDTQDGQNMAGLITVDSRTIFIDLRAGNEKANRISSLSDLLDCEKGVKDMQLRVLVNGKLESDGFRHAYVVVVEKAVEYDDAAVPKVSAKAAGSDGVELKGDDFKLVSDTDNVRNGKTRTRTLTYDVKASTAKVNLGVVVSNASDCKGLTNGVWTNSIGQTMSEPIVVDVPATGSAKYTFEVSNFESSRANATTGKTIVIFNVSAKDGTGTGTEEPAKTYDLTLAGTAFSAGDIVTADGKTILSDNRVAPFVYKIPKGAVVKINFASGGAVGSTNADKTYTVEGNAIILGAQGSGDAYEDTAELAAAMTTDVTITMAANGTPTGSTQLYSIKAFGGVTGTWTGTDGTQKSLSSTEALVVPTGGTLEITAKGDGAAVVAADAMAGGASVSTGALASTSAAQGAVMGVGAKITVDADITLVSATPVTVKGESSDDGTNGAQVTATCGGISFQSDTGDAAGIYMPVGVTLTAAKMGTDTYTGFIKTANSADVTAAESTPTFQIEDGTPVFVKAAYKLTFDTGLKAHAGTTNSDPEIATGSYVFGDQTVKLEDTADLAAVVDNSNNGYGTQSALVATAGKLTADTSLKAYTKVTLNVGNTAKIEVGNGFSGTQVAAQSSATAEVCGIKSGTRIQVDSVANSDKAIQATPADAVTEFTASAGTASDPSTAICVIGDKGVTFTLAP